jgi:hypothetical protein
MPARFNKRDYCSSMSRREFLDTIGGQLVDK